jgi:hypothetical protein
MLRAFVVALGMGCLALGAWLAMHLPAGPGWGLMILGALVLAGTLLERVRYKRVDNASPGPGWRDTGERFRDPTSGNLLAVWHHDDDGERRYVRIGRGRAR